MATVKGTTISLASRLESKSDRGGIVVTETWVGTQTAILAKYAELDALGWSVQQAQVQDGGGYQLTATYSGDPDDPQATPTVQWTWRTEQITRDLFSLPAVALEAQGYLSVAQYKVDIEALVSDGEAYSLSTANYPLGAKVYAALARGSTGYEVEYFVLTRRRFYAPAYTSRTQIDAVSKLYTTNGLIAAESIPSVVQAALPATPSGSVPTDTAWSWRRREFGAEYDGGNRISETTTWVFALWTTLAYDLVA